MAGGDGSSEEFVEDDSGGEDEEEQEDGDSSASFESEEDDEDDHDGETGDDSDVFETPVKARKRPRTLSSEKQQQKQQQRVPTSAGKSKRKAPAVAGADGGSASKKRKGSAGAAAAAAAATGAGKIASAGDGTAAAGSKGKGKGKEKAATAKATMTGAKTKASSSLASSTASSPGQAERPTPGGAEARAGTEDGGITAPTESSRTTKPGKLNLAGGGTGGGSGGVTTKATTVVKKTAGAAAGSGGAAKTPKAAVSDYMQQSNRPYSCINVFDNLRKKIPKAMVQKLLDELVRDGTLKMQEFSKAKIYYANQDALPNGAGDASAEKMQRLDQEAKTLTSQLESASKQEQQSKSRVMSLSSQPTDSALTEKLETSAQELERAEARNASAKGQGRSVVPGGMKTAKADFNKLRALWVSRKRNAMDVVDMIADGMEKKPKVVMEMLGVEVDEEPIPPKM